MLSAQTPQLAAISFDASDGLNASETYDLLQDRQGFIWIATDNGVCRFNGYEFESFGPKQGLLHTTVLSMFEDHHGKIWMSTLSGDFYHYQNDTILPYQHNAVLQQQMDTSLSRTDIKFFFVDQEDHLYVAIQKIGVAKISPDGQYTSIPPKETDSNRLLYIHGDQALHIGLNKGQQADSASSPSTDVKLLSVFQKNKLKSFELTGSEMIHGNGYHYFACRIKEDRTIFSWGSNLFVFDKQSIQKIASLQDDIINIQTDKIGRIYLCLAPLEGKGGLQIFENYEDLRQGISTKHLEGHIISDVLVDEAGGLWISTDGEGVYYSSNTKVEVYNQQSGFSDDYVNAISLKDEKGPFVGLRNGDCYQLDPSNQKLQSLSPNTGEIYALAYDSYMDQLWKASAYQTSVLELKDQNASNFTSIHFPHVYKKINSHPSGHIWGNCAANYGFAQHDAQSKECLFFARYDNKKLCQWTFCTHEDLTGRIWIGRIDGLFEFKDGDLLPPSIEHPALKLRIEEIKHLADSTLVIGTKGAGVLLWKDDRIQQIDESTGLTTDMIEKIHIDSAQNIWVGTPNGLNRVKRSSNGQFDIYHYTTADGFPSNEITDIDSYGAHIWVATNKGLVHLPPNNRIEKQTIAQPIVSKVIVNYEAIEPDRSHDLSHKESNIQFHFFAIDYQQNGNIPYRFRLHEADPWGYTKSTNVSYAALSPGDYHFEVQAAGKNGQWGPSAKYSFAIHPPFWKQAWFIISGLLFLLGLSNLLYQNRIRKIKNKIQLDLQIQELKRSALQAQMNPHFIFNCLHSIQGFILEKNTEAAIHYLSHFSHLIRDFSSSM